MKWLIYGLILAGLILVTIAAGNWAGSATAAGERMEHSTARTR